MSKSKQLLKIIAEKIAKGGVKSIPFAGALLEEVIFGVMDAKSSKEESAKLHFALQCLQVNVDAQTKTLEELLRMARQQAGLNVDASVAVEEALKSLLSDGGTTVADLLERFVERHRIDVSTIQDVETLEAEFDRKLRPELVSRATLISRLADLSNADLDVLIASLGAGYFVPDKPAQRKTRAAKLVEWAERPDGVGQLEVVFMTRQLDLKGFQNVIPDPSLDPHQVKPTLSVVRATTGALRHCPLVVAVERSLATGDLLNSSLARDVLTALRQEPDVRLVDDYDPLWLIRGIQLSDEYFKLVSSGAGERDWQRDFAQTAAPVLVAGGRSFERSADAHALILTLCQVVATRLRLSLVWPEDPDESNDIKSGIYRAALSATELESDDVLIELKRLRVIGPETDKMS